MKNIFFGEAVYRITLCMTVVRTGQGVIRGW